MATTRESTASPPTYRYSQRYIEQRGLGPTIEISEDEAREKLAAYYIDTEIALNVLRAGDELRTPWAVFSAVQS